jgi:putative FmdB family regulatory protein
MPIYEYVCDECETPFERIVLNRAQEIACPKCGGNKNTIQLSVFAAATNDNGNGSSAKPSGGSSAGGGCCGGGCGCH